MSRVTEIMLVTRTDYNDDTEDEDIAKTVEPIQAYLRANHNCEMARVDGYAGGNKRFTSEVWAAAVDYLNVDKLLEMFRGMTFENSKETQLLVHEEDLELDWGRFTSYSPAARQTRRE